MKPLGLHLAASAVALVTALPLTTSPSAAASADGPSLEHRAATTTTFGPLSPTNDPSVNVTGTVTLDGAEFTIERVLEATEFKDHCFTSEFRWTGTDFTPQPASMCGNWAMTTTEILTQTQPPETVDTRVCSGKDETLDESTCTPWTRIFTGNPVLPTEPQDWGPLKSKRGSASAIGKINGSGLSATLTDRSRATSTCAWALATVTAVGVTTKHTLRACNESKVRLWKHPGLGEAKVKVCSGSKARAQKRTCRSVSFS